MQEEKDDEHRDALDEDQDDRGGDVVLLLRRDQDHQKDRLQEQPHRGGEGGPEKLEFLVTVARRLRGHRLWPRKRPINHCPNDQKPDGDHDWYAGNKASVNNVDDPSIRPLCLHKEPRVAKEGGFVVGDFFEEHDKDDEREIQKDVDQKENDHDLPLIDHFQWLDRPRNPCPENNLNCKGR